MKSYIFYSIIFLSSLKAGAKNYYFSNTGSDNYKVSTIKNPWKNISKVSSLKLNPGDSILLKRGDVFEGSIQLKQSGMVNKPIVVSAYGTGKAPILTGAKLLSKWTQKNGIYTANFDQKASDLYVDDRRQTIARYPNRGFITLDSGKNKQTIYSEKIKNIPGQIEGAFVRLRSIDWVYEIRKVKASTANSITLAYHDLYKEEKSIIPRTKNGTTTIYELNKGYGFYVDGLAKFIDTAQEWSMSTNQLLYKPVSDAVIENAKIEAVVYEKGIEVADGTQNVTIENIQIEKYFYAGIAVGVDVKKININNCNIKNTNVFGVVIDSLSKDCKITNNGITDILGKGIAVLEPETMLIADNLVKRIGLNAGQGFSGINGASAISIVNHESKDFLKQRYANHNIVRHNKVDSCGYNGIRMDGSYNLVEYNIIDHCGLTLNDGSALYCFAAQPGITHHQTFRRNIVTNSIGNNEATPANDIHFNGIYIDNNSHEILIEENTSAGHSSIGLMNNDGSYNNTFENNIVFNCKRGMGIYEWSRLGKTFGNFVCHNTVVGIHENQRLLEDVNFLAPKTDFASYDDNFYIHTTSTNPFYKETKQLPQNSKLNLTFKDWVKISGQDINSVVMLANDPRFKDFEPQLITNSDKKAKNYNFDKEVYFDKEGKNKINQLELQPYQSIILLKKKW